MILFLVLVFGSLSLCERVFFLAFFRGAKGDDLRSGQCFTEVQQQRGDLRPCGVFHCVNLFGLR